MKKEAKAIMLRTALSEKFYPAMADSGFACDESRAPQQVSFRRTRGSVMQVLTLAWDHRGRPLFFLQYTEVPVDGATCGGAHYAASEVTAFMCGLPRAVLRPSMKSRSFGLERRDIATTSSHAHVQHACTAVVQCLIRVIAEVPGWWNIGEETDNFMILPPAPLPGMPNFTCVAAEKKHVSLAQRVFAREWVWVALFYALAVFIASWIASLAVPDLRQVLLLLFAGAIAGAMFARLAVKLLRFVRVRLNGGPFHQGDIVQVIAGPNAGRTGIIYEEWPSREQVRVDLGEEAWKAVSDVFDRAQIIRTNPAASDACNPNETPKDASEPIQ